MMGPSEPEPFDPGLLRLGRQLRIAGIEPTKPGSDWRRVRRGVWTPSGAWSGLTPEQRYAAAVHAAALTLATEVPLAFAGPSAAAVLGLPRISPWPTQIHVLGDPWRGADIGDRQRGSRSGLRRRVGATDRLLLIQGIHITPPARTVIDLARTESLDDALAAADQAVRRGLCSVDELWAEVAAMPTRSRGRKPAALLCGLVDGASMSPGETLSRLQMFRLNLPRPDLQYEYADQSGRIGYVDFRWARAGRDLVGEFDGRVKYGMEPGLGAAAAQDVLWQEKLREDRLRKQADVVRWTWTIARDPIALARELARHGIRPGPRNTWFDRAGGDSGRVAGDSGRVVVVGPQYRAAP